MPDFKWLDDVLPDTDRWNQFSTNLKSIQNSVRDSIEIGNALKSTYFHQFDLIYLSLFILDPRLKQLSENKLTEWRQWFDSRLDDAIEAASTQSHPEIESKFIHVNY